MAGATAVQVGTATFLNPRATLNILDGLGQFMRDHNIADIHNLIRAAHR